VCIGSWLVYPFEAWGGFLDDGLNWEDRRSELIRKEFLVACSVWAICA
jgi:hypothetical protein